MSAATDAAGAGPQRRSRVGLCYAEGPADAPGDRALDLHRVVSDTATVVGCVTVENAAGQRFPVPASLIDRIAAPATPARSGVGRPRSGDLS